MTSIKVKRISMVRESDDDVELQLHGAPDEGDPKDEAYQAELRRVEEGLRELGFDPAVGTGIQKSLTLGSWLLGIFVLRSVSRAATPFVPVLVEWVKGREGRKIVLEKGDRKVEARTMKEIKELWEIASKPDDKQP